MTNALRFEWTRLRTLRSTYWLTGLALLLSAAVGGIIAWVMREDPIEGANAAAILTGGTEFSPLPFTAVFMGILGAFAFGHEYRHGTILSTLAAVPQRGALAAAKCIVVAAWSLALAVVSVAINWVVALVVADQSLPLRGEPVGPSLLGYLGYVVLWGLLGLGLGSLLRNLPGTIVVLLVVPLVVEPLITALALLPALEPIREFVYYLPFSSGKFMLQAFDPADLGGEVESPFGDWPDRLTGGLTFTGWVAAVLAAATVLFHKRDA